MTATEWLNHLASILATRVPRCRMHLASFAPSLAKDIPGRILTSQAAAAVEPEILSLPTYAELLGAIRRYAATVPLAAGAEVADDAASRTGIWIRLFEDRAALGTVTPAYLEMVRGAGPAECWAHVVRYHADLVRKTHPQWLTDHQDRTWWEGRVASWESAKPDVRWLAASAALAQVSQRDSHPRSWIVPLLTVVIRHAEDDGANTLQPVPEPRRYPLRPMQQHQAMAAE